MFEGFEETRDPKARRRLFASSGASLVLLLAVGGALVAVAGGKIAEPRKEPVQVAFKKPAPPPKAPPPPPPPPPPPKPATRKAKVAGNAPSTPDKLSDQRLAEANEADFRSQLGELGTDAIVQVGGRLEEILAPPPPPPPRPRVTRPPLELPEDARPPVPSSANARPRYPDAARKQGREGVVVLRVLVTDEGTVDEITVLAGQEPFRAAALEAVQTWRYEPAVIAGRPAPVYREIRVPFRLRSRT